MTPDLRARWEEHYASGNTPWDTQITPPEVESFWASGRLPPQGLALDIGCGPGTNVLYLARLGLHAIGFDIAAQPLVTGRIRILARAPTLAHTAALVQADVTALPLAGCGAAYILDLGCSHGLAAPARAALAATIIANLRPGGYYHLYAFDRVPRPDTENGTGEIGLAEDEVHQLFSPQLEVVEIIRARPDRHPCRWCLLRKPG